MSIRQVRLIYILPVANANSRACACSLVVIYHSITYFILRLSNRKRFYFQFINVFYFIYNNIILYKTSFYL